jgi:hypothetical protein
MQGRTKLSYQVTDNRLRSSRGFVAILLTGKESSYSELQTKKCRAPTLDGKSTAHLQQGRDRIASLPFWDNPDGKMQPQRLDYQPIGTCLFYLRSAPRTSATVRPSLSVTLLEPGEERRASLGEQRSSARSDGEQRRPWLARSGPGYDGEADGGEVPGVSGSPLCHCCPSGGGCQ